MILITGAGGLLGANLVVDWAHRGLEVVAVDRAWLPRFECAEVAPCDLTVPEETASLFARWRPDCVVHCAALTDVDRCEVDPKQAWRVNVEMSGRLAALAAQAGSQFVYISTDSVFDGGRGGYAEENEVAPLNAYARSKFEGEIAVRGALPSALLVRTNIYGWNMQPKASLAEWVLSRLEAGTEVPGFQDVVFCPILVNDLGDVILGMLERSLSGLYHVVGSEACSKYEFALHLACTFGLDRGLVRPTSVEHSALRAVRPKNTSLCTARIRRALGRPTPDVDAGLRGFRALRDSGFVARLKKAGMEEGHGSAQDR